MRRDGKTVDTTIIYWPERCDVSSLQKIGATCLSYSRAACLVYLLKKLWCTRVEVLLPHRKLGRVVNWFSYACSTTALIDDGLDTLRNTPRNVEPELFSIGTRFYTFEYHNSLGSWLNCFVIDRVANIEMLTLRSHVSLNLARTQRLIIESPPLNRVRDEIGLEEDGTTLVTHSNIHKRVIKNFYGCSINGRDVAIERTLREFDGDVVVGESMVAVFALMQKNPKYRLIVYLAHENVENLDPLIRLINTRDFVKLSVC